MLTAITYLIIGVMFAGIAFGRNISKRYDDLNNYRKPTPRWKLFLFCLLTWLLWPLMLWDMITESREFQRLLMERGS